VFSDPVIVSYGLDCGLKCGPCKDHNSMPILGELHIYQLELSLSICISSKDWSSTYFHPDWRSYLALISLCRVIRLSITYGKLGQILSFISETYLILEVKNTFLTSSIPFCFVCWTWINCKYLAHQHSHRKEYSLPSRCDHFDEAW